MAAKRAAKRAVKKVAKRAVKRPTGPGNPGATGRGGNGNGKDDLGTDHCKQDRPSAREFLPPSYVYEKYLFFYSFW